MRLKILYVAFFIQILFFSCRNHQSSAIQQASKDSTESQTFFPVTQFIKAQLKDIDSMPITPLKIITYNGKTDSSWLKKEDIRSFAQPFLHPEIDTTNFTSLFKQRSFLDQTINAITFSYDPIGELPDTLELKRWDVYIDPQKNGITRIYIVKEKSNNGILQTMQLIWKSNKWCKITTITEQPGKSPDIKEELMKWDFSE